MNPIATDMERASCLAKTVQKALKRLARHAIDDVLAAAVCSL